MKLNRDASEHLSRIAANVPHEAELVQLTSDQSDTDANYEDRSGIG